MLRRVALNSKLTVGYLSGPVDGDAVIRNWSRRSQLDYFGTSYLSEYCEVVESHGARGVVITYNRGSQTRSEVGRFKIYNVPPRRASGIAYHLHAAADMIRSLYILVREGADCVVITHGSDHWFLTFPLRLLGIKIIPALHCVPWFQFKPLRPSQRALRWLNRHFFYRLQKAPILVASDAIGRLVRQAGAGDGAPVLDFLPTYCRTTFADIRAPERPAERPFVILSAGRIEANKGVFDMVEVAKILKGRRLNFELHFCGEGSALRSLNDRIEQSDLANHVFVHGFCARIRMKQMFSMCHAVVVPTRTDCEEGFAMIVAEAALAGRPVVTSVVCPAIESVEPAAVEVLPEDVNSYADALTKLMTDFEFYYGKQQATLTVSKQFFDSDRGYGAALRAALRSAFPLPNDCQSETPHPISAR